MSAPVLGYQQPTDTDYGSVSTPPPGSGYAPPAREAYRPDAYTREDVTPPADIYSTPDSSQEEQGNPTRSMVEQEGPPDETPKQD